MLYGHVQLFQLVMERMERNSTRSRSPDSGSDRGTEPDDTRSHKRHRRGRHRRKWKPYSKMTSEEKKECAAREEARAVKREAELRGKPVAPWNTTQFIMEDRGSTEVKIPNPRVSRITSVDSSISDEDYYESPEEELMEHGLSLEQDFENTYHQVASERLQGLSKTELVKQCLQLEEELVVARDQVRNECNLKISEMEQELARLKGDNQRLRLESEGLEHASVASPVVCTVSS